MSTVANTAVNAASAGGAVNVVDPVVTAGPMFTVSSVRTVSAVSVVGSVGSVGAVVAVGPVSLVDVVASRGVASRLVLRGGAAWFRRRSGMVDPPRLILREMCQRAAGRARSVSKGTGMSAGRMWPWSPWSVPWEGRSLAGAAVRVRSTPAQDMTVRAPRGTGTAARRGSLPIGPRPAPEFRAVLV
ncbi:hypothetical protein GCM10009678_89080 [Actinomadura kijaniata]